MTSLLNQIHSAHPEAVRFRETHGRFPEPFQQLIAHYAHARRKHGATWAHIAKPLPVSSATVRAWALAWPPEPTTLAPVVIQDEPDETPPSPARASAGLVLVSPAGFQVQGLTLEQAAWLLGSLR